jgi:TP901-1 family phage major tail protein
MKLSRLQLFAEAVSGKKIIYLYRVKKDAASSDATAIAFTTENGRTKSKDADATETKDGSVRTPGASEVEITATTLLAKGDTFIDTLEDALDNNELLEIWEVNLEEKGTGDDADKYKAIYFQGYLTELEITANAEENVELSLTFGINGTGARGYATVSDAQKEIASYVYTDTQKTGA